MAGIGEILGLAFAGLTIGNRDPKPEFKNQNNKCKPENTNTRDIYTTNNSRKTRNRREDLGRKRFRDSRRFKKTGVILPNYKGYEDWLKRHKGKRVRSVDFNEVVNFGSDDVKKLRDADSSSDSVFSDIESFDSVGSRRSAYSTGSDDGYHGISMNRPESVIDKMSNLTNNRKFESCVAKQSRKVRNKYAEGGNWVTQFDPLTFDNPDGAVAANATTNRMGRRGHMKRIELERQMEIDGGYSHYDAGDDGTYGVVHPDSPEFIHENMQPFVARGPSAREEQSRNMVNKRKLELFTGSANNVDYRPKVERAPLFSPLIGAENIYGDPVRTDEYKSRYFPGRYKTNELPFNQVKVTPGLNIGYNAVGKQGYHDMYRVVPRGVDEIRTINNPKISYGSYTGPGKKGDKGPVLGIIGHYRAPTFRERDTKDMVRQAAYFDAPKVREVYDPKNLATVNRGVKETMKMGPAAHFNDGNTPGKFRGRWDTARKENYRYDHPRNVYGHEETKGKSHNYHSHVPDTTNRDLYNDYGRAGMAVTGNREQHKAVNWSDVPDVTKREIHDQYDRAGKAVTGNREGYRTIDWNDVPDANMRNIHDQYDRSGKAITGNREQYKAVNYDDVPDVTLREIHDQYDRAGKAISGNREDYKAVNWDDVPDINMRNIHDKYDRSGKAITGNKEGYRAVNWDDVPDINMRNIHDKYDRAGKAISGNREDYKAVNWDDVPDINMRNIHDRYDRAGKAVTGNREGYHAVNWDDVPDVNMRNIHDQYDRAGKAVTGNREQYVAVNWDDVPDVNMRNIHDKYDRAGKAVTGNREQYVAVNWDDVPDVNMRNIHDQYDRAGKAVTGNKEQYVVVNWDDVPDVNMRNIHDRYDRAGKAVTGNREGYHAVDWDDVPDITMREIHSKYDRAGKAVTGNREGYHAIDWSDVPDVTMREIHGKYDRAGKAVTGNKESYLAVNWDDVPDVTMREIHPGGRNGHAYSHNRRQSSRHQYMVMRTNAGKESTKINRAPTRIGMQKGYTLDHTAFEFKCMPNATWRPGPGSDVMYTNDSLASLNTKVPVGRVWHNDRILSHTAENLQGNPYVQNLLFSSVNAESDMP